MPETDSSAEAARELLTAFGRLYRRFKELSDNRQLTPSQASVLSRLGKDGPASASDLAAAERVRPQAVTPTLAALLDRGLVERRPDPGDRRRHLVSLTAQGRALFEGSRRAGDEWLAAALSELYTEDERRDILRATALLARLTP